MNILETLLKGRAGRRRIVHVVVKQYLLLNHLKISQFSEAFSYHGSIRHDIYIGVHQVASAEEMSCQYLQHMNGE